PWGISAPRATGAVSEIHRRRGGRAGTSARRSGPASRASRLPPTPAAIPARASSARPRTSTLHPDLEADRAGGGGQGVLRPLATEFPAQTVYAFVQPREALLGGAPTSRHVMGTLRMGPEPAS